ncbi:bacteriocin immunity protein [Pseudomonas chlororaphis]|uniref:bacteriocin immunity protein n=1 Tax=Pseudomonas chlororaphis TaxID=587753 RepID=UPI0007B3354C|nr:bacteriocin immunity protein [Pseudomonas chlororaphis]AZC49972.1 Colicin immunity protein/pyocin immunity protein [Pseudomonas chlororaphis subsp. piscium]AZC56551.1 Colicin immunity protein/pyocin immunity protein [Pseudomonas chlororaphis subsp. piscium]AZC62769.1 Colicin immunity protein/pyocin immunity protein [Pseudomonas chlororaphis subsp. piscium]AZC69005.1 Colicin immunity protein/pyocin immunity protein [Pseudomonas chlororaphis subsp. piscium]AZC75189.1 Colicin immunity protein/
MAVKSRLDEYTEAEFIDFMQELFAANKGAPDEVLDPLLDEFERITEHPAGSDLIYYPENGADSSAVGIIKAVKDWRRANGLPGFKAP